VPIGEGGRSQRPVIVVIGSGPAGVVRELLAGIEEEGVPYAELPVSDAEVDSATVDLAIRAARRSPLQVGVGIGPAGDICVCHAKVAEPIFELPAGSAGAAARTLGHNAARMVVGLPLRS
jgi:hypothetical protein